MKDSEMQLYVVTHSEEIVYKIRNDEIYTPLMVGRDGKDSFGFCSDDDFEGNISYKNPYYCELTGLYWMWKQPTVDIIGLCHYRRYFKSLKNGKIIEKDEILEYLSNNDIILPKKADMIKGTYWENFKDHEDYFVYDAFKRIEKIIEEEFNEYYDTFERVMNQSSFASHNMFICKKELIAKYCDWVFPILTSLENTIDVEDYPRIFGIVTEALLNVWCEHYNLKIMEVPIYYLGAKLRFRMFLTHNKFLRKTYSHFYFKYIKNNKGSFIEKTLVNIFFKLLG